MNKTTAIINNIKVDSLIDTGSMVSTVTESFYRTHLHDCVLEPLNALVKIECADGEPLPYIGVIEAEVQLAVNIPVKNTFP